VKNTTLGIILPFPYRATSETECDWTNASTDRKKAAVTLGDIKSNALSDNEMRRKSLTHLLPNTHASPTPLARNVKDQRSATFALTFQRRHAVKEKTLKETSTVSTQS
jgi:hypothetical protein